VACRMQSSAFEVGFKDLFLMDAPFSRAYLYAHVPVLPVAPRIRRCILMVMFVEGVMVFRSYHRRYRKTLNHLNESHKDMQGRRGRSCRV
jgi:hypothetical protein